MNADFRKEFVSKLRSVPAGERFRAAGKEAEQICEFYRHWNPAHTNHEPSPLDVFPPYFGALRSPNGVSDRHWGSVRGAQASADEWIAGITHLALYTDRVWIPDPCEIAAEDIFSRLHTLAVHEGFVRDVEATTSAIEALSALQPLIDAGVVALYPPMSLYRNKVSPRLFGGQIRDFSDSDLSEPEMFVKEGLLYSEALDAHYAALSSREVESLGDAMRELQVVAQSSLEDRLMWATLPRLSLPIFNEIDPVTLAQARLDEGAFEDFRALLREVAEPLRAGPEDPGFDAALSRLEQTRLSPEVDKLHEQVRGIASLRKGLAKGAENFVMGAFPAALLGSLPAVALTGLAAAGIEIYKALFAGESPRPAARFVYYLKTGRPLDTSFGLLKH